MLFDSHAHLNETDLTAEECEERASSLSESEVKYMMDVGFDWPSTLMALEHAKKYSWCYAAAGVHPHDARTMSPEMLDDLRDLILSNREDIKAVGEIGLDFHYDLSPRDVQREWFRKQIRLALELDMPIVIHSREADQEVMDILVEEGAFSDERKGRFPPRKAPSEPVTYEIKDSNGKNAGTRTVDFSDCTADARVDIHCFSGSRELGIEYVKLGATLGVDGPLTYKNNKKTVAVFKTIPLEFIMTETDSPYLTPVPFRGKPNRSEYVRYVAEKLAEIKGITYEEVCDTTLGNALRFFNIKETGIDDEN